MELEKNKNWPNTDRQSSAQKPKVLGFSLLPSVRTHSSATCHGEGSGARTTYRNRSQQSCESIKQLWEPSKRYRCRITALSVRSEITCFKQTFLRGEMPGEGTSMHLVPSLFLPRATCLASAFRCLSWFGARSPRGACARPRRAADHPRRRRRTLSPFCFAATRHHRPQDRSPMVTEASHSGASKRRVLLKVQNFAEIACSRVLPR